MDSDRPSFFVRLWLCWVCFFRVLFDSEFAGLVLAAREGRLALPPAPSERAAPEPVLPAKPEAPAPSAAEKADLTLQGGLQVLALLQREGRLIDFVQQDVTSFPDADVGAAARVVHQGCRKAIAGIGQIAAIRSEPEGSSLTLEPGFDRGAVKLVGNVQGKAPYRGVLRHKGWRVEGVKLPQLVGDQDPHVLAPAEVEL